MYRIPIPVPFYDFFLLVTPRWGELHWVALIPFLSLCFLLPAALVVWLYYYEARLIRRRTALFLLSFRLLVLWLLLFIGLLQPVVIRTEKEELPGRVVVAVDRSDSIDVADPQRPAVDKLRLARALKLVPDICADAQLDAWIKQYQEKGRVEAVAPDEFPNDPTRRRELAEQRRKVHDEVCKRVDGLTRSQVQQRLLGPDGLNLLEMIAARHQVELVGFTYEAWDVKSDHLAELFEKRPTPGMGTDLRLPLARSLERSGTDQGKILAVVMLTDGQHNWGQPPAGKAKELGDQKMPVYPVALGAENAPPAIAIAAVKAPPAVFKEVDANVEARVLVTGLPAQEVLVELTRPGQSPLIERIRHDGQDRTYAVNFQVRLDKVGMQTLTLTAKQRPDEVRPDVKVRTENSSRDLAINVADDKVKVLLIDGEARWEYHYLASALARDRTMQLNRVVFQQPRLGKVNEDELKKLGNPSMSLPAEPDALSAFDCIVLGDVTPTQLPFAERVRLEKYVADRGGTLVILAGKRAMPMAFLAAVNSNNELDPLLKLLPVTSPRPFDSAGGFKVALTDEGKRVPFLQLEGTADKSQERWAALPTHHWAVIGQAKPGATTLASFVEEERGGRRPALNLGERVVPPPPGADPAEDEAAKRALVARQNYGFGRVLYVGLDSTWRWRYKTGDTYHHRFWGQVVRWAASDKPLVAGNEQVRFGTRDPVYGQGQEIDVVVRLGDDVTPPGKGSLAGARIIRVDEKNPAGQAVALVPLEPKEAQPRLLEGKVRDLPPGKYQVELAIPELADKLVGPSGSDGLPAKYRAPFTVTGRDSAEMVDLGTNWPLLREIAGRSGGKVYTPENAAELGDLLKKQGVTHVVVKEWKLWLSWGTLILFLTFLTCEWVARKIAGLP